jgi:hypothetical protein
MTVSPKTRRVTSMGDLARRIRSGTLDLFAVALVLAVAILVGRQLVLPWRSLPAAPEAVTPAASPFGQVGQDVAITFPGGSMNRELVAGPRSAAEARLVEKARALIEQFASVEIKHTVRKQTLSSDELEYRRSLLRVTTFEESPGRWRLVFLEGEFPVVVGLRWIGRSPEWELERNGPASWTPVCWGCLAPSIDGHFALLTGETRSGEEPNTHRTAAPHWLPETCEVEFSLGDPGTERWTAFSSGDSADRLTAAIHDRLTAAGYRPAMPPDRGATMLVWERGAKSAAIEQSHLPRRVEVVLTVQRQSVSGMMIEFGRGGSNSSDRGDPSRPAVPRNVKDSP